MGATARTTLPAPRAGERWELGSEFDLSLEVGHAELPWLNHPHSLWGSGRDALRALLRWGHQAHGWRRVLAPSYFCQDILAAADRDFDVALYPWAPFTDRGEPVASGAADVVLSLAPFGMPPTARVTGATLIEDHTHDPLSPAARRSRADYVLVSLRKTMPLPDGGVIWSPLGREVPPEREMTAVHARAVLERVSAMMLKREYLAGHDVEKAAFRELAVRGERAIAAGPISGISPFSRLRLGTLPLARWRRARHRNLSAFGRALGHANGASLQATPFAATLVFAAPELRDRVRATLIAARIYPSILWPLDHPIVDGVPRAHRALASRILSIHCDHRYGRDDMVRAAAAVREALR